MNPQRHLSRQGAALLIVLCLVVLLSIVVLAFLSQSIISRQIFTARAGQSEVDVLGGNAVEFMKADLRQEIISGSTNNAAVYSATNSAGVSVPVFIPSTNYTVVPSRTGFTPGTTPTADPYANLVKMSKYATNFFSSTVTPSPFNTTTYPSPNYASPSSTGDPSLNGRYIDNSTTGWTTNGWDKPELIDTTSYTTALQPGQIPLPDWIYVTTSGRKSPAITAPEADVVGRYAFVVYDEGGLLDINTAGFDATKMSPADAYDVARKGSLGLADLTQIPGITTTVEQAIVAWRNHLTSSAGYTGATASSYPTNAPAYLQYLVDSGLNNGFLKTPPGDQTFLSRQDLLAYAPTLGIPAQSLAYLGTFTRTLNAPTWTPIDPPGAFFTSADALTPVIATSYAANAELNSYATGSATSISVVNRDIINVRWPKNVAIIRPALNDDGGNTGTFVPTETVTFNEGDPLVQHRFPLSKIQLLSNPLAKTQSATAPVAGASKGSIAWAVKYYFGLVWVATDATLAEPHWQYQYSNTTAAEQTGATDGTYQGGSAKFISTLHQLASITPAREPNFFEMLYAGKLKGSGPSIVGNCFEIGANIIDQFDSSDTPCVVSAGHVWFGKENLPYLLQILFWPYRPTSDPTRSTFEAFLVPELWNPHRNAATLSPTVSNLRLLVYETRGGNVLTVSTNTTTGVITRTWTAAASGNGSGDGGDIFANFNPKNPANTGGTATFLSTNYYQTDGYNPAANATNAVTPPPTSGNGYYGPDLSLHALSTAADNTKPALLFTNSTSFQEPTILSPTNYTGAPSALATLTNNPTYSGSVLNDGENPNRIGFYLGYTTNAPDQAITPAASPNKYVKNTEAEVDGEAGASSISFKLQYSPDNITWSTYEWLSVDLSNNVTFLTKDSAGANGVSAAPSFSSASALTAYGALSVGMLDPRMNNDFLAGVVTGSGYSLAPWNASVSGTGAGIQPTWRPNQNTTTGATLSGQAGIAPPVALVYPGTTAAGKSAGLYCENNGTLTYQDAVIFSVASSSPNFVGDFVTRPGDGANGAYPMATSNIQDRSIILNRPFLSVGELGYAFSGMEWRTLDFSSPQTGDSGLLDLFSLNDTENANQQSMIGGVLNINTHNPSVLQAMISGGLINGLDSTGAGITSADAQAMANAIVNETVNNRPLLNRAELASRVASLPAIKTVLAADTPALVTKDRREAVVRALAEPADTRTWNLLIDLVVQAGHYPPTAITAGTPAAMSQFAVQGERRYWLHLAIDRYTGKVIDERLEAVQDN